jgi:capsular exopolysaccharide synthesis family protein
MDELTRYEGGILGPNIPEMQQPPETAGPNIFNAVISLLLRRWRIVVIVFILICSVGLSVVWQGLEPKYEVTGAIRVAPISSNILTGETQRGEISNYQTFMNTQAVMISSTQVVQRVADDLADKRLSFFNTQDRDVVKNTENKSNSQDKKNDYAASIKQAIDKGVIQIAPARDTELIKITIVTPKPQEAQVIVDAFIRAYMAVEGITSAQSEDQTLNVLEDKRRTLSDKLTAQRESIRQLAQEYGTVSLDSRQKMMLDQVSSLLAELTQVEKNRINLESRIEAIKDGNDQSMPDEWLKKRSEHINTDPGIQELLRNSVLLEQDIIAAKQIMTPQNPLLKQKEEFLESFKKRISERREDVGREFDAAAAQDVNLARKNEMLKIHSELEQTSAYETRLREKLAKEDDRTIELGRKQLNIQDMQYQLELDKGLYDQVMRRIQELEMERKQPARISVAYAGDIAHMVDKRIKYTFATIFLAFAGALVFAFLKDKADQSLQSPEDITRLLGVRIIGTMTRPGTIEKALLPRQLTEDYQTIRANLGLLDSGGIPKKLVVTSAGMRDGKTTFSVNLATSLSRSGCKVLLIDGDLRKPDVGRLLNVPRNMRRLLDVLMGNPLDDSAIAIVSPGLHVLASDSQNTIDPYELLVLPSTAALINKLAERYDHVIIDTPPVLAFPDALILAQIAGSVILASFAGHTSGPDLKETRDRLAQINVRILGTVMGNVHLGHTYHRYGYHYYAQGGKPRRDSRRNGINPLLLSDKPQEDSGKPTS